MTDINSTPVSELEIVQRLERIEQALIAKEILPPTADTYAENAQRQADWYKEHAEELWPELLVKTRQGNYWEKATGKVVFFTQYGWVTL